MVVTPKMVIRHSKVMMACFDSTASAPGSALHIRLAWPRGCFGNCCACFAYVLRASDERDGT